MTKQRLFFVLGVVCILGATLLFRATQKAAGVYWPDVGWADGHSPNAHNLSAVVLLFLFLCWLNFSDSLPQPEKVQNAVGRWAIFFPVGVWLVIDILAAIVTGFDERISTMGRIIIRSTQVPWLLIPTLPVVFYSVAVWFTGAFFLRKAASPE